MLRFLLLTFAHAKTINTHLLKVGQKDKAFMFAICVPYHTASKGAYFAIVVVPKGNPRGFANFGFITIRLETIYYIFIAFSIRFVT